MPAAELAGGPKEMQRDRRRREIGKGGEGRRGEGRRGGSSRTQGDWKIERMRDRLYSRAPWLTSDANWFKI